MDTLLLWGFIGIAVLSLKKNSNERYDVLSIAESNLGVLFMGIVILAVSCMIKQILISSIVGLFSYALIFGSINPFLKSNYNKSLIGIIGAIGLLVDCSFRLPDNIGAMCFIFIAMAVCSIIDYMIN